MDNLTLIIRAPEYPISEASSVFGSFDEQALVLGLICVVILLTLCLSVCHKTITACITVNNGPRQDQKAILRRDSVFLSIVEEEFQHQIERTVSPNRPPKAGNEAEGREKTTTTTRTKEVHGNLLQVPESMKKKGIRKRALSAGRDDNIETDNSITTKTKKKKKKTLVRFLSQRPSKQEREDDERYFQHWRVRNSDGDGEGGAEETASIARFAASLRRSQTAPSPRPRLIFVAENPSF